MTTRSWTAKKRGANWRRIGDVCVCCARGEGERVFLKRLTQLPPTLVSRTLVTSTNTPRRRPSCARERENSRTRLTLPRLYATNTRAILCTWPFFFFRRLVAQPAREHYANIRRSRGKKVFYDRGPKVARHPRGLPARLIVTSLRAARRRVDGAQFFRALHLDYVVHFVTAVKTRDDTVLRFWFDEACPCGTLLLWTLIMPRNYSMSAVICNAEPVLK